jgi:hypothetical protein
MVDVYKEEAVVEEMYLRSKKPSHLARSSHVLEGDQRTRPTFERIGAFDA